MTISNINQTYNAGEELIVSAELDGIQFNNITHENDGVKLSAPAIRQGNNWSANKTSGWKPAVNAVDIDWNGADFENALGTKPSTINTTGDLINAIKWSSVSPIADEGEKDSSILAKQIG